ncbi:MAG: hypothetical protein R2941_02245 [Desulfobacterales bacterium]
MTGILNKSLALALSCVFLTIPWFHYLIFLAPEKALLPMIPNPNAVLGAELFLLFVICFLSSIAGFTFSKRVGLPGFGTAENWMRDLPLLAFLGFGMIVFSWLLFDRHFIQISPVSYPDHPVYLLFFPLKGALADEIIMRFCLLTICIGLLRRRIAGIVIVSGFASVLTLKYFRFIGISPGFNYLFVMQMLLSFVSNFLLGYVYVTRGLLSSMTLKLIFGAKYVLIVLFRS